MTGAEASANLPVTTKRLVCIELTPGPPMLGPAIRKKLLPVGEPVTAWAVKGLPIYLLPGLTGFISAGSVKAGLALKVVQVKNGPIPPCKSVEKLGEAAWSQVIPAPVSKQPISMESLIALTPGAVTM